VLQLHRSRKRFLQEIDARAKIGHLAVDPHNREIVARKDNDLIDSEGAQSVTLL